VGTAHHPVAEVISSSHLENSPLIARVRAVEVVYEFPHPGVDETEDNR